MKPEFKILEDVEYLNRPPPNLNLHPYSNLNQYSNPHPYPNMYLNSNQQSQNEYARINNPLNLKEACSYGPCNVTLEDHPEHCYKQPDCKHSFTEESEYRTLDGSCNNKYLTILGMAGTPYRRILPADYSSNNRPRTGKYGKELPSSKNLAMQALPLVPAPTQKITYFASQFWKLVLDDLVITAKPEPQNCCFNHKGDYLLNRVDSLDECYPIISYQNHGITCDEFMRDSRHLPLDCNGPKTEQIDTTSMWLDLSNLYPPSCKDSENLTECINEVHEAEHAKGEPGNPTMAILHLLWRRYQDKVGKKLQEINPHWSKEKVFQMIRKVTTAVYQNIIYAEFLPFLLGDKYVKSKLLKPIGDGFNQEYEDHLDARISNEFATAAFRLSPLDRHDVPLVDLHGYKVGKLHDDQFRQDPTILDKEGMVDQVARGSLMWDSDKKSFLNNEDLLEASYSIQGGRDHGIPGYNRYLELVTKKGAMDFSELLRFNLLSPAQIKFLSRSYKSINDVDLWVGGILESPHSSGVLGPTFKAIITEQFKRLKYGDRLWFENEETGFSLNELHEIRKTSFAALMCDNFDIKQIQQNVFLEASARNKYVSCSDLLQQDWDVSVFADQAIAVTVDENIEGEKSTSSSPQWSYSGLTGPEFWSQSFPNCGGQSQSPIDVNFKKIVKSNAPSLQFFNYDILFTAILEKTKKNIDMEFSETGEGLPEIIGGYIPKGIKYRFAGLHFHWGRNSSAGSEHRLNGKESPAEAHFVHYNTKYEDLATAAGQPDGLLVLGFFLQVNSRSSSGLKMIVKGMNKLNNKNHLDIGHLSIFKITGFVPHAGKYVFYKGSLTTPPCTENVLWHLFPHPIPVTENDLDVFRAVTNDQGKYFSDNYRPDQPINGRQILMNGEDISVHMPPPPPVGEEDELSPGKWSYKGITGPEFWKETYPSCGGFSQSPIDIPLKYVEKGENLELKPYLYSKPLQATLLKGKKNIDLEFGDASEQPCISGGYIPNKNRYEFAGLHFHWGSNNSFGSEHLLNSQSYPAEAHFVHFNKKYVTLAEAADKPDGLLVLGFFLKISQTSTPGLRAISEGLKNLEAPDSAEEAHIGKLSIYDILGVGSNPLFNQYVYYQGSLTTPPCTENVQWHVFPQAVRITQEDLDNFRRLKGEDGKYYSDNFRPVQPINGRKILWKGKNLNALRDAKAYTPEPTEEIHSPKWSYSGITGPKYWPLAYPACGGKSQSPINLPSLQSSSSAVPLIPVFHERLFPTYLEKGDHNVDMKFRDENNIQPLVYGGYLKDIFEFHGLHFHWGSQNFKGSEHRVNGFEYPGEAHFVHFNRKYGSIAEAADKPDGLLVLGFFLKLSAVSGPGMQLLIRGMMDVQETESDEPLYIGDLSMQSIVGFKPNPAKYAFYRGSLTTPPCTENVFWHVLTEPIKVTESDLQTLRLLTDPEGKSFSDNNRPVQPLNGRQVILNGVLLEKVKMHG